MRVLYVYQPGNAELIRLERGLVERLNQRGVHHVDFHDWGAKYGFDFNPSPVWTEQNRNRLAPFHDDLLARSRDYDAVLIAQTGAVPPDLMARISPFTIYNTADDPDSSATSSFPYLQAADLIAHAGVNYDARTRMGEAFRQRGAARTCFFPLGFYEEQFPPIERFDEGFARRDIPLVYVGHLKRGKLDLVMRRFRGMRVHSHSLKWKHQLYLLATTRRMVSPYRGGLADLYARCQVGINIHYSFGPSNTRSYQLCASGVAQVIDCPEGSPEIYEDGREVLIFSSLDEAVAQIESLLADESLRHRIARAGYERARRCYGRSSTFAALLEEVAGLIAAQPCA